MSEVLKTHSSDAVSKGFSAARRSAVVFAALASLAMLGSPIQAAFGAVTQVREVDDPGRIPYQAEFALQVPSCPGQVECVFTAAKVPAGHRLVIQHVAALVPAPAFIGGTATSVSVAVQNQSGGIMTGFLAQLDPTGQVVAVDRAVQVYFDGGQFYQVTLSVAGAHFSGAAINVTVTGYLLDCTVAPCAAIAQ